jgi:hypothetical protein
MLVGLDVDQLATMRTRSPTPHAAVEERRSTEGGADLPSSCVAFA